MRTASASMSRMAAISTCAVRPEAPLQLLFTGHMDTVFGADHRSRRFAGSRTGVLGGPGVADMKGGIAVMLAALKAVEAIAAGRPIRL